MGIIMVHFLSIILTNFYLGLVHSNRKILLRFIYFVLSVLFTNLIIL